MSALFNADEVFAMALRIEENGAKFYRKAASVHADKGNVDFLEQLAAMEDGHYKTFEDMRKQLSEREKELTAFDPFDEQALYLEAMADMHGGEGTPSAADALTGKESMEDILNTAMNLEKQSILFYQGLKDMVGKKLGQDWLDTIIKEEAAHVATLMGELKKLQA
jgi:rubrerythrin